MSKSASFLSLVILSSFSVPAFADHENAVGSVGVSDHDTGGAVDLAYGRKNSKPKEGGEISNSEVGLQIAVAEHGVIPQAEFKFRGETGSARSFGSERNQRNTVHALALGKDTYIGTDAKLAYQYGGVLRKESVSPSGMLNVRQDLQGNFELGIMGLMGETRPVLNSQLRYSLDACADLSDSGHQQVCISGLLGAGVGTQLTMDAGFSASFRSKIAAQRDKELPQYFFVSPGYQVRGQIDTFDVEKGARDRVVGVSVGVAR
jgi:hypothetical protein